MPRRERGGTLSGWSPWGRERVREAIQERQDVMPFAIVVQVNRDAKLLLQPMDHVIRRSAGVAALADRLEATADEIWGCLLLVDPGEERAISVMVFEGAHRGAPPFRVLIPWQRGSDGDIAFAPQQMVPGSLALFTHQPNAGS